MSGWLTRACGTLGSLIVLSACGDGANPVEWEEESLDSAQQRIEALLRGVERPLPAAEGLELLYESVQTLDSNGELVESAEAGVLEQAVRDRVARPYQYTDEDWIYVEEAWESSDEQAISRGYRVFRQPNPQPQIECWSVGPPVIASGAKRALGEDPDTMLTIDIRLRNFPNWDIPLVPEFGDMSIDAYSERLQQRADALAVRAEIFRTMSRGVVEQIEAGGGWVVSSGPKSGWIIAQVTPRGLASLAKRTDLESISNLSAGTFESGAWNLGDGRSSSRTEAGDFISAGYDGDQANPTRHQYGDITVAVIEPGFFEDEACFLFDGPGCTGTSRLQEVFDCDDNDSLPGDSNNNYCESFTNLVDGDTDDHGTGVASMVLGDYRQGQGNGKFLGDDDWLCSTGADCASGLCSPAGFCNLTCSSGSQCESGICESGLCAHSSTWEARASGMAPEARLIYFGQMNGDGPGDVAAAFADALDDAFDRHVDITSNSWGWHPSGDDVCDPRANLSFEREAEAAFDDGIVNVACAGNNAASTCQTWAPGSIPKTVAVNGLKGGESTSCESAYHEGCLADRDGGSPSSAIGGADVITNGTLRSGAATVVDMIAPSNVRYWTKAAGANGEVDDSTASGGFGGCSAATPHVAGLAALLKDWYLASGNSFINSPGRLHTLLIGMTDRHFGTTVPTTQKVAGADKTYGLGRAKLRLLQAGGPLGAANNNHSTWTFVPSSGTVTHYPFGSAGLAGSPEIVKCVLMQFEDTSADGDPPVISDLDLSIYVYGSSCTGSPIQARHDFSSDWKSMVALEASDVSGGLSNKCIRVAMEPFSVETGGITAHLWCYSAEVADDDW